MDKVVGLSSDGLWVELAIDKAPGGAGWVSANFVTVQGSITDVKITKVGADQTTTPSATPAVTVTTQTTVTVAPPAPGMATVKTAGPRLRVRSQPSADAPIVGYAYTGESYRVVGKSDDGKWIQIAGSTIGKGENPNGGWVSAEFLVIGQ